MKSQDYFQTVDSREAITGKRHRFELPVIAEGQGLKEKEVSKFQAFGPVKSGAMVLPYKNQPHKGKQGHHAS
jgi:hypothetical protein